MDWRVIPFYFAAAIAAAQTINGVVISSTDHQPIRKATVTLRHTQKGAAYVATSDAAGQFRFEAVEPGKYVVVAERQGYFMPPRTLLLTVAEQQQVRDARVELVPFGVIRGRVLDSDGEPVIAAQVRAAHFTYDQPTRVLNPTATAITNDLGEYELADLRPERYYVIVKGSPGGPPSLPGRVRAATRDEGYPFTIYPGVLDVAEASAADVAPGARVAGIDFRLQKAPAYHIRGRVEGGRLSEPIELHLAGPHGWLAPPFLTRPETDGSFDFRGLTAGAYYVSVAGSGREPVIITDRDVEGVTLAVTSRLQVTGSIRAEEPDRREMRRMTISLISVEPGFSSATLVDGSGSFTITDVFPAVHHLEVVAGAYVKSIRFGDQDARSGLIDLTNGGGGPLDIVLGNDPGQIEGSVQNEAGEPVNGAIITVVPADEFQTRRDLMKTAVVTGAGSFKIGNLAPGDYKVWAWEQRQTNNIPSLDIRKALESKAVSVSVKSGSAEKIQLKSISVEEFAAARAKLP